MDKKEEQTERKQKEDMDLLNTLTQIQKEDDTKCFFGFSFILVILIALTIPISGALNTNHSEVHSVILRDLETEDVV